MGDKPPLHEDTDALRWGYEFAAMLDRTRTDLMYRGRPMEVPAIAHYMLPWFAAAIECGRDAERRAAIARHEANERSALIDYCRKPVEVPDEMEIR